ncbi:hypothetical protein PsorP6_001438 [Peronosclerospora sorghi]|uniref:Uncharacterized protein n=1 Tax=Peronosclerospora sorghi TaxID=230839 RepID=A0ACC0WS66_9STRA|nr:hypothetical protein PsorP6_001438 [Peronosclerospora sorghi]
MGAVAPLTCSSGNSWRQRCILYTQAFLASWSFRTLPFHVLCPSGNIRISDIGIAQINLGLINTPHRSNLLFGTVNTVCPFAFFKASKFIFKGLTSASKIQQVMRLNEGYDAHPSDENAGNDLESVHVWITRQTFSHHTRMSKASSEWRKEQK